MITATLTDYLPLISEVPEARAAAVRARLAVFIASGWSDLDTAPNSPFGDLHLTPLAFQIAALEIAGERMFSDLVLENVASGVVWNCDYVKAYLKNFAAIPRDAAKATGVVRLRFSTDVPRTVDRRTLFAFEADNVFAMRLAAPGHLSILPVGTARTELNQYVLSQTGRSTFVADVPVAGIMGTAVPMGASGTLDSDLAGLVGVSAVNDFLDGTFETSVTALAKKTRETFYSATLTSRGGATAFLAREFPEIVSVSPVVSGDLEMLRDSTNALGLVTGCLDVCSRSSQSYQTDSQLVKLVYDAGLDCFYGKLDLAELPVKIDGVTCDTAQDVNLTYVVYSASNDPRRAALATAAYTELEQLYLEVTMPRSGLDRLITVEGGYGYFNINYRFDPGIKHVTTTLNSSDVRPVGVDVMARGFMPVVISSLLVEFVKAPGKQVNISQARQEILDYVNGLGFPDVFLDSAVGDSMLYAGASGVKRLQVTASAAWSVASRFLPDTIEPLVDWSASRASALTPPALNIDSTGGLTPSYRDPALGTSLETLVACGKRNVCYILDSANLNFSEYST